MTARRRLAVVALVALGALALIGGSAAADRAPRQHFSATALAIPSAPGTNADEHSTRIDAASARNLRVDGVATASLTCDGCSARAVTVQVLYARRGGTFAADNVATAWTSGCTGCGGWALSLQIVIAPRAGDVTAANRALAVNADCVRCSVAAAAVQIIVVAPTRRALSPYAIGRIMALRDQLVAELRGAAAAGPVRATPELAQRSRLQTAAPAPTSPLAATTAAMQQTVAGDLLAGSATHAIQLQVS